MKIKMKMKMKKTIISMALVIAVGGFFGCGNSNKQQTEEQAYSLAVTEENVESQKLAIESEADVKGFFALYAIVSDAEDAAWIERCDSLLTVYCSDGFRKKVTDEFREGVGFDHVTCDNGISQEDIESLKVSPESDGYRVQYSTKTQTPDYKDITKDVKLKVTVADGRITDVEDLTGKEYGK